MEGGKTPEWGSGWLRVVSLPAEAENGLKSSHLGAQWDLEEGIRR